MGDFGTGITSTSSWTCPNDRQLALRAKLRTGWSVKSSRLQSLHSFTKPQQLDDTEQEAIMTVIKRAEDIERVEMERVGRLVEKLENMKKNAIGNGASQCVLCGDDFGLLGASNLACNDCRKCVCSKCGVDTFSAQKQPLWLCKICAETREMWKKSGAWFFKGLPKYVLPKKPKSNRPSTVPGSPAADGRGRPQIIGSQTPPTARRGSITSEPVRTSGPPPKPARNFNTWSKGGGVPGSGYGPVTHVQQQRRHRADGSSQDADQSELLVADAGEKLPLANQTNCAHSSEDDQAEEEYVSAERGTAAASAVGIGARIRRRRLDSVAGIDTDRTPSPIVDSPHSMTPHQQSADNQQIIGVPSVSVDVLSGSRVEGNAAEEDDVDRVVSTYCRRRSSNAFSAAGASDCEDPSVTAAVFDDDLGEASPEEGSVGNYGTLEFSLLFDSINGAMHCTVHRAKGLRAMDCNGLSDPYVKLHLLPGASKSNKLRTKTVHKTLNPEFNETLTYFGVTENDVARKTLRLSVLDDDMFGHDALGEVRVPLKHVRPHQTKHFHVYLDRQHPLEEGDDLIHSSRGKILLSLRYSNQRQGLVVGIVRCSHLQSMDSNGFSDPFVKIQLKPDPLKKRYKTAIKWKNLNPEFNEEFLFEVKVSELTKRVLEITVWDKDYGRTNDYLGGLQIGLASKGGRLRHWVDVLKNPDHRHDRWHHLGEEVLLSE